MNTSNKKQVLKMLLVALNNSLFKHKNKKMWLMKWDVVMLK